MSRKDKYQLIEVLRNEDDDEDDDNNIIVDGNPKDGHDYHDTELFSPSPLSSSPPKDFDINFESQYVPIFDENNSPNQDVQLQSSSLASSLSIGSNHDYHNSPIISNKTNCRVIRCPACEKPMRTFYCAKCIQKGHYVTMDSPIADRFTKTKLELPIENEEFSKQEDEEQDQAKILEETLQVKLRALTRKTEALKTLYDNQKSKLDQTKALLKETKQQLDLEKKSQRSREGKIELIKRYIASRKASVRKRREAENNLLEDMKHYIHRRVYQLTTDIFPIDEINLLDQSNSFVNMETSPLLTFSDGSHHQIEQQTAFSIVEPWLPSNGDYSAYSLWVNDNQDHVTAPMSDLSERNPAFRIGAALSYTVQLVNNLASYLDVILPAKLELDTFNRELLNDPQFSYNVAKLNANVIHLCVSQGVDVSLLNPHRTLKNLILLLNINISDLGRRPIIELDNEEASTRIEEQLLGDLSLVSDSFYDFSKFADDDDASDSEWEISDTINPMEMQLATEQSIQQNSYISRLPLRLLASFWSTGS